jgi:hypothetical protein
VWLLIILLLKTWATFINLLKIKRFSKELFLIDDVAPNNAMIAKKESVVSRSVAPSLITQAKTNSLISRYLKLLLHPEIKVSLQRRQMICLKKLKIILLLTKTRKNWKA